jgi:hypothetical protein
MYMKISTLSQGMKNKKYKQLPKGREAHGMAGFTYSNDLVIICLPKVTKSPIIYFLSFLS